MEEPAKGIYIFTTPSPELMKNIPKVYGSSPGHDHSKPSLLILDFLFSFPSCARNNDGGSQPGVHTYSARG